VKYPRADALKLVKTARKLITGRGKNIVTFDMVNDPPDDDKLAAAILGPSGNLRAPTIRIGDTLLVGFNEAAYKQFLS
jgi:arsenate reductase-like glutaredoxin family protein